VTPDQWTEVSSWGVLAWAISATVVMGIQIVVFPEDRQEWSALLAIGSLAVILWRIWISYRFGLSLGGTEQGIVFFLAGAVCWSWFGWCSWAQNRGFYRARLAQLWRRMRRRVR
jgi:hypothetical protein